MKGIVRLIDMVSHMSNVRLSDRIRECEYGIGQKLCMLDEAGFFLLHSGTTEAIVVKSAAKLVSSAGRFVLELR